MKNILAVFAVLGTAVYLLRQKVRAVEFLQIDPLDIAIDKKVSSITGLVYNVKLGVFNPTDFPVRIRGANINYFINGMAAGTFNDTGGITIPGRTTVPITIRAKVSNLTIAAVIIQLLTENKPLQISAKGTILSDLGTFDFEVENVV